MKNLFQGITLCEEFWMWSWLLLVFLVVHLLSILSAEINWNETYRTRLKLVHNWRSYNPQYNSLLCWPILYTAEKLEDEGQTAQ